MKLQLFLVFTLLLSVYPVFAQQAKRDGKGQNMVARLGLQPQDTAAFLTLLREYQSSKKANRKALNQTLKGMAAKSDSEMSAILTNVKDLMEKESDLNKNYLSRFEAILTPRQTLILLQSKFLNMSKQIARNKGKWNGRGKGKRR